MLFRLQIVLTFVIALAVVAAAGYFTHQGALSEALQEDAARELRFATHAAVRERALDEATLRIKAESIASDPKLSKALTEAYEDKESKDDKAYARHMGTYQRLLVWKITYDKRAENIKDENNLSLAADMRQPLFGDLLFVVDREGVGVAAFGKDLKQWFGPDVAKNFPMLNVAMSEGRTISALWQWSYDPKAKTRPLYQVVIVPVRPTSEDKAVGALVMGRLLNDGAANRIRSDLAGKLKGLGAAPELDRAESPQIAFYKGKSIQASSMDPATQQRLSPLLFGDPKLFGEEGGATEIVDDKKTRYLVSALPYPKQLSEEPAGVIAISPLAPTLKPLQSPGRTTLAVAVIMLLLGVIGLMAIIQMFLKPIADIEEGVLKVIAGNKEYEFVPTKGHPIATGLAQQLNNMSAFLQGKRLPDEEDQGGSWGDMGGGGGGSQGGGPAPRVQGVSMADLMGQRPANPDGE